MDDNEPASDIRNPTGFLDSAVVERLAELQSLITPSQQLLERMGKLQLAASPSKKALERLAQSQLAFPQKISSTIPGLTKRVQQTCNPATIRNFRNAQLLDALSKQMSADAARWQEAISALVSARDAANSYLAEFPSIASIVSRSTIDASSIVGVIPASKKTMLEKLAAAFAGFDWENWRLAHRRCGECGWALYGRLPNYVLRILPANVDDADAQFGKLFTKELIQQLFDDLEMVSPKKRDLKESIVLFEARHYKPCAMMLTSMIEGELIKADRKTQRGYPWRNSRHSINNLVEEVLITSDTILSAEGTKAAYEYFFKSGDDFTRSNEGELNRNFLLHGMMYKRVKRLTCIKLFVLLYSVEELILRCRRRSG